MSLAMVSLQRNLLALPAAGGGGRGVREALSTENGDVPGLRNTCLAVIEDVRKSGASNCVEQTLGR